MEQLGLVTIAPGAWGELRVSSRCVGVDFGNHERDVGVQTVRLRVRDDEMAGLGERGLGLAGDARVESGEDERAIERRCRRQDFHGGEPLGQGSCLYPARRVSVELSL